MKERWKPVKGYEDIYEVSNFGNVRSVDRYIVFTRLGKLNYRYMKSKILKQFTYQGKDPRVNLCKDGKFSNTLVYKIVAEAWIPNPDNYSCIVHLDSDKNNNKISNLMWMPYRCIISETIKAEEAKAKVIWKPIPEFEGLYEISNTGKVRSIFRNVTRTRCRNNKVSVDEPSYESTELKPIRYKKKTGDVIYHLHKRYKPGYYGQTDVYCNANDLVKKLFTEVVD